MEQENNQGKEKLSWGYYVAAAVLLLVLFYYFGGLLLVAAPFIGLKVVLG